VRWYGMMYLFGFIGAYFTIRHLARKRALPLSDEALSDLIFWCVCGVILGGRLGYTLFYNTGYYLAHPLRILAVWEGGMSFHGGFLGVFIATLLFCHRRRLSFLLTADIIAASAPIGLGLGRLGNFINGELWGRVTDVPWGMVFPGAGPLPRHPSQLYEAVLEGPVLWLLLWFLHRRQVPFGVVMMTFFLGYGLIRCFIEFFRQPDAHLGFLWGGATMGQLLSLPMIVVGGIGLVFFWRRGLRA
jgi:phosphatidylglycerol:prolipoprotein diacylglycerol transferase